MGTAANLETSKQYWYAGACSLPISHPCGMPVSNLHLVEYPAAPLRHQGACSNETLYCQSLLFEQSCLCKHINYLVMEGKIKPRMLSHLPLADDIILFMEGVKR
ncbi:hypothetical protein AMTR_s00050p00220790 [Amborella trichopoda]|uniref:Uncharacterized protein n=1 Tax=Amborella trichopoda TaxID=13333 RepID=W1PXG9_AMBTC|nr:hypothetical protein AMTR_s00050p00220790 [Amborella trichopoda]